MIGNCFFFFHRRCRKQEPGKTPYELLLNTLSQNESSLQGELFNKDTGVYYTLVLTSLKDGLFRLHINEKSPIHPRYEVEHSLQYPPQLTKLEVVEKAASQISIVNGQNKAVIHVSPFKIDLYSGDQLVISANARGLMRFEHLRTKPEP